MWTFISSGWEVMMMFCYFKKTKCIYFGCERQPSGIEELLDVVSWHRAHYNPQTSVGLRSGLKENHSRSFVYACFIQAISSFDVCLRSLSCRNNCVFSCLAGDLRWRFRRLCSFFIIPTILCSVPAPLTANQLQSMMLPPPCLTVGSVFLCSKASKHTYCHCGQID